MGLGDGVGVGVGRWALVLALARASASAVAWVLGCRSASASPTGVGVGVGLGVGLGFGGFGRLEADLRVGAREVLDAVGRAIAIGVGDTGLRPEVLLGPVGEAIPVGVLATIPKAIAIAIHLAWISQRQGQPRRCW